MEENPKVLSDLLKLLQSGLEDDQLADRLSDYHEADIADLWENLDDDTRKRLARVLKDDRLSEVFSYLENAEDYVEKMDKERAADIIESMDADDAVDLLDELEEETRSEIIRLMDGEAVEDIKLITSYGDDRVGSLMTTNFILVRKTMSVRQAMKGMVEQAAENDNVSTIYVEDDSGRYCGAIDLRDLIVAREGTDLDELIIAEYPSVNADEKTEECIERLKDYGEDSIPVLNASGGVIGVITASDLIEVVGDRMGEDYAKFGGLTSEVDIGESVGRSMIKRIPWLTVLFFLGLGVSAVVSGFETVISSLPFIVSFQSLILDMAGNVGTQSLAVTIRVLTDDRLARKQAAALVLKEVCVGFFNGLILGSLSCALIGAYLCITVAPATAFVTSGCIGAAMLLAMVFSGFFGTVIPLFFKMIKIDPAVASGPMITTVNDLVAVATYYGLAWMLLINLAL